MFVGEGRERKEKCVFKNNMLFLDLAAEGLAGHQEGPASQSRPSGEVWLFFTQNLFLAPGYLPQCMCVWTGWAGGGKHLWGEFLFPCLCRPWPS